LDIKIASYLDVKVHFTNL